MITRITSYIFTVLFVALGRLSPAIAATGGETEGALNRVINRYLQGLTGGACPQEEITGIFCVIANLIDKLFAVAAFVALMFFVCGGLQYMASGGDPKALTVAKATISYSILGLFIILGAILIINTILVNLGF